MHTHLHDTVRDLGIGVGGPAGGLLLANVITDPTLAKVSIMVGIIAGVTVIIRNAIGIHKDLKK
jgi:hypothetical protein